MRLSNFLLVAQWLAIPFFLLLLPGNAEETGLVVAATAAADRILAAKRISINKKKCRKKCRSNIKGKKKKNRRKQNGKKIKNQKVCVTSCINPKRRRQCLKGKVKKSRCTNTTCETFKIWAKVKGKKYYKKNFKVKVCVTVKTTFQPAPTPAPTTPAPASTA